jgi:fructuronate reductase
MTVDVLHIGLGNFHRAHQCVYFARAGLSAASCSLRNRDTVDSLAPRGGRFTLLTLDGESARAEEITSLAEPVFYPDDPEAWLDRFAEPSIRLVTITVTEKGYPRNPEGGLAPDDPDIRRDLQRASPPRSMVGVLVDGLARRRATGLGGLPVVSCDNLPGNGEIVARLVTDYARKVDGDLARWIEAECRFPSTMVDCIVPAIREEDRLRARALLGYDDPGLVVAEPFRLWVLEDRWAGERPLFDGPDFLWVKDAAPFDAMKLRLLNAVHTALACLGQVAGYEFIWQAATDPVLSDYAGRLQQELLATVPATPGYDQETYIAAIGPRFSNQGPAAPDEPGGLRFVAEAADPAPGCRRRAPCGGTSESPDRGGRRGLDAAGHGRHGRRQILSAHGPHGGRARRRGARGRPGRGQAECGAAVDRAHIPGAAAGESRIRRRRTVGTGRDAVARRPAGDRPDGRFLTAVGLRYGT